MILDILLSFLLQIACTLGLIFVFGFLTSLCNKWFYSNAGSSSRALCYITGFIGTPVHELSHALFCLIFGHKIHEIKLFQINSEDGTLGYVSHSYNRKNIYQRIGNFFIGIAPIIVISLLLYLLAYFLLPDFIVQINGSIQITDFKNDIGNALLSILGVITAFFSHILSWQWWVFVVVGMFLALHMNLSREDIRGALSGLLFTLIAVLIVDIVLGLIGSDLLNAFTQIVLSMSSYLLCIFLLTIVISILSVLISLLFKIGKRR
ncbi:MAG: metalloprotease family protein [Candidatus Coproplasma sp.]